MNIFRKHTYIYNKHTNFQLFLRFITDTLLAIPSFVMFSTINHWSTKEIRRRDLLMWSCNLILSSPTTQRLLVSGFHMCLVHSHFPELYIEITSSSSPIPNLHLVHHTLFKPIPTPWNIR